MVCGDFSYLCALNQFLLGCYKHSGLSWPIFLVSQNEVRWFTSPSNCFRFLAVLLALLGVAYATTGFDAIDPLASSKFQCMKTNGHSFYIARVFRSSGTIDSTGVTNMQNAWAGMLLHK